MQQKIYFLNVVQNSDLIRKKKRIGDVWGMRWNEESVNSSEMHNQ